ncbi:uncharacterized protein LOC126834052 [Adelges cooleyi]|uniref:uncharacterized protein LOC126834052 n=1 Tax=Adelges cooleyi TaxID=133065 RepID=UPI00218057EA|nr:uncharacterized protein LOC126834052 [Adelges cooleyi]
MGKNPLLCSNKRQASDSPVSSEEIKRFANNTKPVNVRRHLNFDEGYVQTSGGIEKHQRSSDDECYIIKIVASPFKVTNDYSFECEQKSQSVPTKKLSKLIENKVFTPSSANRHI